ncbi:MAG: hypothetical protein LBQ15_10515 [Clostridium sp.]|jgi:hypothetical protein|nr:hypothetical protein [Clostridium sp.]
MEEKKHAYGFGPGQPEWPHSAALASDQFPRRPWLHRNDFRVTLDETVNSSAIRNQYKKNKKFIKSLKYKGNHADNIKDSIRSGAWMRKRERGDRSFFRIFLGTEPR